MMHSLVQNLVHLLVLLFFPLLLLGVINRVKAWAAGRKGPSLFQGYYDVLKLLQKGAVYSYTTTWIFRTGPLVTLAALFVSGLIVPLTSGSGPLHFAGDVLAFAYLLALGRFFTMAAALDTGSSFEGMGASREAGFSALAEPATFLSLAILCVPAHSASFATALAKLPWESWGPAHPTFLFAVVALGIVLLTENARIPVDDPNTHLELTMVHEVMILDHGGPDLAFILYASALKLLLMTSLLVHLLLPIPSEGSVVGGLMFLGGCVGIAVVIGIIESTMARLRLRSVPQLLIGAAVIAAIGLGFLFYRGEP